MQSSISRNVPQYGSPMASLPLSSNFGIAADEITDLMGRVATLETQNSSGSVAWGDITGSMSEQDDLHDALTNMNTAIGLRQPMLSFGGTGGTAGSSNIKSVGGTSLQGTGDIPLPSPGTNGGVSIQDVNTWLLSTNPPTGAIAISRIPVSGIDIDLTTGTIPASRVTGLPSAGGWNPGDPVTADLLINNPSAVSRLDLQTGTGLPSAGNPFGQIRFLGQGEWGALIQTVSPNGWPSNMQRPTRLDIMVNNGTTSVTAMQISPEGGIGIGQTAPATAGHVRVQALYIGNEEVSDYVSRVLGL